MLGVFGYLVQLRNRRRFVRAAQSREEKKHYQLEFLKKYSHVGRSALTIMFAYADDLESSIRSISRSYPMLLEQVNLDECFAILQSSRHSSLFFLNRLVEYYGIQGGNISLSTEPVSLPILLQGAVSSIRTSFMKEGVELVLEKSTEIPIVVADRNRVEQIFRNIMSNGMKYTQSGKVEVVYGYEKATERFWFKVTDTGRGMTSKQIDQLFKRDGKGDDDSTRPPVISLGIGMLITKELVDMMNGTIEVKSEGEGFGTVVKIHLHLPKCKVGERGGKLKPGLLFSTVSPYSFSSLEEFGGADFARKYPLQMMIVEDSPQIVTIFERIVNICLGFESIGQPVLTASNGRLAFQFLQDYYSTKGNAVDLVFMDLNMPEIGGIECTRLIRNDLPMPFDGMIVTLTGSTCKESKSEFCSKYGFDYWMEKPFRVDKIAEIIRRVYEYKVDQENIRKRETRRLMLVDDISDSTQKNVGMKMVVDEDTKKKKANTHHDIGESSNSIPRKQQYVERLEALVTEVVEKNDIRTFSFWAVLVLKLVVLGFFCRGVWISLMLFLFFLCPWMQDLLKRVLNLECRRETSIVGAMLYCWANHVIFGNSCVASLICIDVVKVSGILLLHRPGRLKKYWWVQIGMFLLLHFLDIGPLIDDEVVRGMDVVLPIAYFGEVLTIMRYVETLLFAEVSELEREMSTVDKLQKDGEWYLSSIAHELSHPSTVFFTVLRDLGEYLGRCEKTILKLMKKRGDRSVVKKEDNNIRNLKEISLAQDYVITTFRASQFIFQCTSDLCEYFRMKRGKLFLMGLHEDQPLINLTHLVHTTIEVQRTVGLKEVRHFCCSEDFSPTTGPRNGTESPSIHIPPTQVFFTSDLPKDCFVRGDGRRIADILCNLVSNSAKYCRNDVESIVEISVSMEKLEDGGGIFHLIVKDNGKGMTKQQIQGLRNDNFFQDETTKLDPDLRIGFGLFMNRHIVEELMGGSVNVESDGKTCTVIHVSIPFDKVEIKKEEKLPFGEPVLSKKRMKAKEAESLLSLKSCKKEENEWILSELEKENGEEEMEIEGHFSDFVDVILLDDSKIQSQILCRMIGEYGFRQDVGNVFIFQNPTRCIEYIKERISAKKKGEFETMFSRFILITDFDLGSMSRQNGLSVSKKIKHLVKNSEIESVHYLCSSAQVKFEDLKEAEIVKQIFKPYSREDFRDVMALEEQHFVESF